MMPSAAVRPRRAVDMPLVAVSNVLPCFANWPVARLARLIPDVNSAESRPSRSEEHTSELQSQMRISYAVFCLKKKKKQQRITYKPWILVTRIGLDIAT